MISSMFMVAVMLTGPERELAESIPNVFSRSVAHYLALDASAVRQGESPVKLKEGNESTYLMGPHGYNRKSGTLDMRSIYWWTAGHYPGSLWLLYEATGDVRMRDRALFWTERLSPNATADTNHDLGFITVCSFGNARRILKTDQYDDILHTTAKTLCGRYHKELGLIRSWGKITDAEDFLVIPDSLMNLELLELAVLCDKRKGRIQPSAEDCDKARTPGSSQLDFDAVARSHADVTMKHHFRLDGGAYHVLDYDQVTGRVKEVRRGQGASCETTWSRGQSWAIYGYTMMYRMTREKRYLDFALKLAAYAMNHPNMPADGIPYWDYGAPGEERDSSAGSCMASALLELSQYLERSDSERCRAFAVKQLLTLTSSTFFSEGDEIGHFLLKHGVGHKPIGSEVDTPLDYGDYYFLEALLRFRKYVGLFRGETTKSQTENSR